MPRHNKRCGGAWRFKQVQQRYFRATSIAVDNEESKRAKLPFLANPESIFDVLRIFKIRFRYGGYLRILIHIQDAMATPWRSMKAYPPVVAEKQQ